MSAVQPKYSTEFSRVSRVEIPFDRVLTPVALSIAPQEGKLGVVGFQFQLSLTSHADSLAVLGEDVPQSQLSFGRI